MRRYYPYDEFLRDTKSLAASLRNEKIDAIVAITRGGLTLAHMLAMSLDLRTIHTIRASSYEERDKRGNLAIDGAPNLRGAANALVVDEIVDSGETMVTVLAALETANPRTAFKTAALFQKTTAIFRAHYFAHETDEWVDFFWEVDPF
ncbi:nicotinate phosphoribosyltransferase [Campylobacterota bacterium]|nr:nicotinate phosphoribosyltransferase [Campylobacterota bacterium]